MRYLFLFGILIAASVTLPFARLSETPVGQPVPPVQVATLGAMPDVMALGSDILPAPDPVATAPDAAVPDAAPETAEVPEAAEVPQAAEVLDSAEVPETAVLPEAATAALTAADSAPLHPHLPVPLFAVQAFAYLPYGDLAAMFDTAPRTDVLPAGLPASVLTRLFLPDDAAPADLAAGLFAMPAPAASRAPDPNSEPLGPVDHQIASLTLDRNTAPIVIATLDTGKPAVPAKPAPAEPAPAEIAAPAPADATPHLVKVTASALNMRAGPSSNHPVVAGLTRGAVAEALGDPRNGWVRVRLQGSARTGWLFTRYVETVGGA